MILRRPTATPAIPCPVMTAPTYSGGNWDARPMTQLNPTAVDMPDTKTSANTMPRLADVLLTNLYTNGTSTMTMVNGTYVIKMRIVNGI